MTVRRGDPVHATDGDIGRVTGLVIGTPTGQVTHVLLQEGHFRDKNDVASPVRSITRVSDVVQVAMTKPLWPPRPRIHSPIPQGAAAVLIALVLIRVSLRLIQRSHDFLVGIWAGAAGGGGRGGRRAAMLLASPSHSGQLRRRVRAFLLGYPGVTAIRELLVTFVGPGNLIPTPWGRQADVRAR